MTCRPIAEELLLVPPGTRYHVPDTGARLPYLHNPFAAELVVEARRSTRPLLTRCLGESLAGKILGEDDIVGWPCFVYPLADRRRTRLLIDTSLAAIVCDDAFTRTALSDDPDAVRRRVDNYAAAIRGRRPPPEQEGETWTWRNLRELAALSAPAFTARLRRRCLEVNDSVLIEARHRATGMLPEWDEYLSFRRVNLYGFFVITIAEFSVGVDMTAVLAESPELRALELAAVDHVMFSNDLYSFPKEARLGEVANTFWLLRRDGMTIQEAVDHLAGLVVRSQDEFLSVRESILAGPLGRRADIHRYLDAVSHFLGGCLRYHQTVGRYHGPGHDGTPVTNGTVVIGDRSNTFVPDSA